MGGPSIADAERELVEEFALFDNWVDRYQYIIDLGRQLPPFPEAEKTEERKIKGCQSQVWLVTTARGRPPRVPGHQRFRHRLRPDRHPDAHLQRPAVPGRSWPRHRASSRPSAWTST